MKLVIVKHVPDISGKLYLFEVPESVSIRAGDQLFVSTVYEDNQTAVAMCDSYYVDGKEQLEDLCKRFGTTVKKMKPVTARVHVSIEEFPKTDSDAGTHA